MLELGVDAVILGTAAVNAPEIVLEALERFGAERIQLGVDARDGRVAVQGWVEDTALQAAAFGRQWRERGIARAVYTDIATDGMLRGPNLEATGDFARDTGLRVTASGGVTRMEDVRALAALEPLGVDRIIIGRALYEGTIDLEEALTP